MKQTAGYFLKFFLDHLTQFSFTVDKLLHLPLRHENVPENVLVLKNLTITWCTAEFSQAVFIVSL